MLATAGGALAVKRSGGEAVVRSVLAQAVRAEGTLRCVVVAPCVKREMCACVCTDAVALACATVVCAMSPWVGPWSR